MARDIDTGGSPLAVEFDVGGDDDMPGLAQPLTSDDIDALLSSTRGSATEKRHLLGQIRDDLEARRGMDLSGDMEVLIQRIDDALATLSAAPDEYGTPASYGMDPQLRASSPEEELERAEEEAAEDRSD